jgi:hypothetical protein
MATDTGLDYDNRSTLLYHMTITWPQIEVWITTTHLLYSITWLSHDHIYRFGLRQQIYFTLSHDYHMTTDTGLYYDNTSTLIYHMTTDTGLNYDNKSTLLLQIQIVPTYLPYLYMLPYFRQTRHYNWRNHYIRNEELYTVNRHCTLFDPLGTWNLYKYVSNISIYIRLKWL